ncbi:MAG: energy transducer TonB [Sphingomonadaceae bacterium]|nr:energy transducer TonB [Sphingomonadaceae bacterium]MCP5383305.1 energy transducer TonB [Altererythrobacter sp.]MCP5393482.1 energy transducer TonB [Sphingomonadaceae bacterium]
MQTAPIRPEEKTGLMLALFLHLLLLAVLLSRLLFPVPVAPAPERVTVSLAEEVGLEATAPEPVAESRAAIAPTLSEAPVALPPAPVPETRPDPRPQPRASAKPRQNAPTANRDPRRRPDKPESRPSSKPSSRPSSRPSSTPTTGGSRIGSDFLPGQGSSTTTNETRIPANQIGASARASIGQAIARQVKPHFQGKVPTGADAEKLVTILAFELNPDGSLKGRPRVVRQLGVTPANEAQKARHAEVAIRAVQLAAPFDLPDEYYNAWKSISGARFDRNLSL